MQLSAQAFGSPRADGVAGPARRQPAGAATRRGLGRLRADGRRGGARPRRRHRRLPGPRRPRRARRAALAVVRRRPDGRPRPRQAGPPARRRGRRRRADPAASSSRRCATPAPCKRGSDGQLRLTPKAMRQLGKALLRDVAERMSGRQGQRDLRRAGAAGELSGATREWAFGDTEPWDVPRTMLNAVRPHRRRGRLDPRGRRPPDDRGRRGAGDRGPHPGRAWRCSSTRRSRWRWTAAGCR